jgi:hypothetical protein
MAREKGIQDPELPGGGAGTRRIVPEGSRRGEGQPAHVGGGRDAPHNGSSSTSSGLGNDGGGDHLELRDKSDLPYPTDGADDIGCNDNDDDKEIGRARLHDAASENPPTKQATTKAMRHAMPAHFPLSAFPRG